MAERLRKSCPSPFPNIGLDRYYRSSWASGKAMRQRSRASGKPIKARRGKAALLEAQQCAKTHAPP